MKPYLWMVLIVIGVSFAVSTWTPALQGQGNNGESEVQRGFEIAPVPLNYRGSNRSLVGQGSYYVNGISDCVGCHTGASGHLGGGNNFGVVLTRNLTPDAQGRPAGLTLDQFKEALRHFAHFEGLLSSDGALIVKIWLHLSRQAQRARLQELEADADTAWRVSPEDWKLHRHYARRSRLAEDMRRATDQSQAPWHLVPAADVRSRNIAVGQILIARFYEHLRNHA